MTTCGRWCYRWAMKSLAACVALAALVLTRPATADDKRKLPDYDGRGGDPTTAGDVALWVPRVILAPPYIVSEYLLRRPLGALITGAERSHLPQILYSIFAFGPDHKAGIVPTGFVEFGFVASVGLYGFWDNAFFKGNDLRVHLGTGGADWQAGSFSDRIRYSKNPYDVIRLDVSASRRPDYAFFGVGPTSTENNISRFGEDRFEGGLSVDRRLWRLSALHAGVGARSVDFHHGHFFGDPSLEQALAANDFPTPPGYPRGYTAARSEMSVAMDSRKPRPEPGSGVRVELRGSQSEDIRQKGEWVTYGGSAGAFFDLDDRQRVLSVSGTARFADPLGSGEPIPFTELVQLGGFEPMRGFFPGRLVGRSGAVGEIAYKWPIWIWLDGSMRFEVGNVFDEHLRDFRAGLLRASYAIGVESSGSPDNALEILFGIGSETFESGAKIDSVRLTVGTNHGF